VHRIDVVDEPQIAQCFFDHYIGLLGTPFSRTRQLDLNLIGLPSCDLSHIENIFSEEEVRKVVIELPNDKAPGPDGFTGQFYKVAWEVIKGDVMAAINAFWARDGRSFSHLNGAVAGLVAEDGSSH
jgi:hypothetical protein